MIEPVVAEHDCELVDVDLSGSRSELRGRGLLRITVDNPDGDGRVSIERCVAISREIGTLLDAEDAMPGAYSLEVSSPGLDRVLGREKDFMAAIGQQLKLRTRRPIEGRKRFRGRLVSFDAGLLKMAIDGADGKTEALVPFEEVEKANTIYEFTRADFARESATRGGKSVQSAGTRAR